MKMRWPCARKSGSPSGATRNDWRADEALIELPMGALPLRRISPKCPAREAIDQLAICVPGIEPAEVGRADDLGAAVAVQIPHRQRREEWVRAGRHVTGCHRRQVPGGVDEGLHRDRPTGHGGAVAAEGEDVTIGCAKEDLEDAIPVEVAELYA